MFLLSVGDDLRLGASAGGHFTAFEVLTHFLTPDTFHRDVLLPQDVLFPQNGMHQNQPGGTCAAPSSLCFPNLSHLQEQRDTWELGED